MIRANRASRLDEEAKTTSIKLPTRGSSNACGQRSRTVSWVLLATLPCDVANNIRRFCIHTDDASGRLCSSKKELPCCVSRLQELHVLDLLDYKKFVLWAYLHQQTTWSDWGNLISGHATKSQMYMWTAKKKKSRPLEPNGCRTRKPGRTWLLRPGCYDLGSVLVPIFFKRCTGVKIPPP